MKLSIVIICWNNREVLDDCLRSLFATTKETDFEVILADNGSTDGSVDLCRRDYPSVIIVENGANIGFARGNNPGIDRACGKYILILNPDTVLHEGALDKWIQWADERPHAGAFGCRVLNPDGSYQEPARRFPTPLRSWASAFGLGWLGRVLPVFQTTEYHGWEGRTEREIDWQYGCALLCRGELLKQLGGFDDQFFCNFEEVDLCRRIWESGHPILFFPGAEITHIGGNSTKQAPIRFYLEKWRNRYRYYNKWHGEAGMRRGRHAAIAWLGTRSLLYALLGRLAQRESYRHRARMYAAAFRWNWKLNPVRFVEFGEEPDVGFAPVNLEGTDKTAPSDPPRVQVEAVTGQA